MFPHDEEKSSREEVGDFKASSPWVSSGNNMTHPPHAQPGPNNRQKESPPSPTVTPNSSRWVYVHAPGYYKNRYGTPSTDGQTSLVSPVLRPRSVSPVNGLRSDFMEFRRAKDYLQGAEAWEWSQASLKKEKERDIKHLDLAIDRERSRTALLGAKVFGLFVVMTQNQQHELDELQCRLLDLQTDAESWQLGPNWRLLQEDLHTLNSKLDEYIQLNKAQCISARTHTDDLMVFPSRLLQEIRQLWIGIRRLRQEINKEKRKDAMHRRQGKEDTLEDATSQHTVGKGPGSEDVSIRSSMTNILSRHHEFSLAQRERIVMREKQLRALLEDASTELTRLQADVTFETRRMANVRTRMMLWGDDLAPSKADCIATLAKESEAKQSALKCELLELEKIVEVIHRLSLNSHIVDLRVLGEE
ncbi:hypothetical protein SAMD00023353_0204220 [Rosellinia necatrix]|uniref:Uncharacterized protein n=1 Tax=Rosellinia necatrix TaxID=77044 RepID=A0A1W2TP33_ROSNE|nr:hypothetical protein SAMD00023353_0204220 [Rosellinia necatrix]